ncbi:TadE/TadG family type IV pilus assembly protein [Paenibacillus albus]|uniref:Pilus assembly protein n=1 Tax=Paenibacillus albus TaxID=2495582 RepID=A0A3Q8XB37_9BACL|nr:TadE family protein [Paenibacillus albus]AZN43003.1 pilus assembly protein [Paenibacillus albus]
MKRPAQSVGSMDKRRRGEDGSITLEASLIMPTVLMVFIFLICFIRLSMVQMALHGAVSQAVREVAANIHPVELAMDKFATSDDAEGGVGGQEEEKDSPSPSLAELPGVSMVADKLESWLPPPSGTLLAAALRGDWKPVEDAAATEIGRSIVEPLLARATDGSVLEPEQLRLSKLSLPDLKSKQEAYILIEASYSFKLGFPFTKKAIVLKERAEERVWVSDPVPSLSGSGETGGQMAPIQIVLIEPTPAKRGNKARVVVKTTPGRSLSIEVLYKSGRSVAKHLGNTNAGDDGMAEWTWLVSGNTTPGVWEIVVSSSDGAKAARHFVVEKKAD